MPITFLHQRKKQKYLLLIFGMMLVVIVVIIWGGFFKKEKVSGPPVAGVPLGKPEKIKINFDVLENPALKELQPFEEIQLFEIEEMIERGNPFLPLVVTTTPPESE